MTREEMLADLKAKTANLNREGLQALLVALEDLSQEELVEEVHGILEETFNETEWSNDKEEQEFYTDVCNIIGEVESEEPEEEEG
jgi:fumarylacetoacetate (FAA) hydrolase family protein